MEPAPWLVLVSVVIGSEIRLAFALFLGLGHISPLAVASANRWSYSAFVGRPRFFLGGSTGLIVTGDGIGCPPLKLETTGRG